MLAYITGDGGSGKTRLADALGLREVQITHSEDFEDVADYVRAGTSVAATSWAYDDLEEADFRDMAAAHGMDFRLIHIYT